MTQLLSLPDVRALACDCLMRAGVPDHVARAVAAEIAAAEAVGERCNGMEALLRDIRLLRYGRIHAAARSEMLRVRPGLMRIDAGHGFCRRRPVGRDAEPCGHGRGAGAGDGAAGTGQRARRD